MAACTAATTLDPFPVTEVAVDGTVLTVWEADQPSERGRGLRRIDELPSHIDGMLFVFPSPTTTNFVMEDTLLPLDLWFFDQDGVLIGLTEMEPCPAPPCPRHPSPRPVAWALETPAGRFHFPVGATLDASP